MQFYVQVVSELQMLSYCFELIFCFVYDSCDNISYLYGGLKVFSRILTLKINKNIVSEAQNNFCILINSVFQTMYTYNDVGNHEKYP